MGTSHRHPPTPSLPAVECGITHAVRIGVERLWIIAEQVGSGSIMGVWWTPCGQSTIKLCNILTVLQKSKVLKLMVRHDNYVWSIFSIQARNLMSYFEHWLHKSSFENGSLPGVALSKSISHSHKNTSHKTTYSQLCRHEGICTCHDHSGCSIEHVMVGVQNPCKKQVSSSRSERKAYYHGWSHHCIYHYSMFCG